MELTHVRAFRAVAEHLHFGRAAERLHLSTARVSQLIRQLEREVGAPLFDRTSRRTTLTAVGQQLLGRLVPAHDELVAALADARAVARPVLRIGFTPVTGGTVLDDLVRSCALRLGVVVDIQEISPFDPFGPLRAREIDAMLNWLVDAGDDLDLGPPMLHRTRALLVADHHPLASRASVSTDDIADHCVPAFTVVTAEQRRFLDAIVPTTSRDGRTIPTHPVPVRGLGEAMRFVARGETVWPTVSPVPYLDHHDGVRLVPIDDLPPLGLGLIWVRAHGTRRRWRAVEDIATESATGAPDRSG